MDGILGYLAIGGAILLVALATLLLYGSLWIGAEQSDQEEGVDR